MSIWTEHDLDGGRERSTNHCLCRHWQFTSELVKNHHDMDGNIFNDICDDMLCGLMMWRCCMRSSSTSCWKWDNCGSGIFWVRRRQYDFLWRAMIYNAWNLCQALCLYELFSSFQCWLSSPSAYHLQTEVFWLWTHSSNSGSPPNVRVIHLKLLGCYGVMICCM